MGKVYHALNYDHFFNIIIFSQFLNDLQFLTNASIYNAFDI